MIDLSAVQHVEILGADFVDKKFMVLSNERVDTGAGILKGPIMPLPTLLLGMFGTPAIFYLDGVSEYNPETGEVVINKPTPVKASVYPEAYTSKEIAELPEVVAGDIKLYVPGQAFGYAEIALLILQVRRTGAGAGAIS